MAAVLCKSIGELCVLPCKLCSAGCRGCNGVCGPACKGCGQVCDELFKLLCRNPFSVFVAVALFTQGPAIFLFIPAISGSSFECPEFIYLIANAVLAAVNVFTAFYLAYRIVDTSNQEMGDTAFKRATYLMCHDPWIAVYICLFIGFMCVQAWGSTLSFGNWFQQDDIPADDEICNGTVSSMLQIGTALGWTFCSLGFTALLFSMCCAKFGHSDYSQPANNTNNNSSVPHGSYDANQNNVYNAPGVPNNDFVNQNNAYNAQGVPNNDFVQPEQPQGGKKNTKPSSSAPMYTQQGVPTNDFVAPNAPQPPQQEEIPMAYAQEIPQGTAPPSTYDTPSGGASAGATATGADNSASRTSNTGGKVGGTAGKQIGKLFTKDQAKQEKIAKQGEKAGEAVQTGLLAATNFVKSKLNKKDDKKNNDSEA